MDNRETFLRATDHVLTGARLALDAETREDWFSAAAQYNAAIRPFLDAGQPQRAQECAGLAAGCVSEAIKAPNGG